jgi:hypothetical protein
MASQYTVPGLGPDEAKKVAETLQERLTSLVDLPLTPGRPPQTAGYRSPKAATYSRKARTGCPDSR